MSLRARLILSYSALILLLGLAAWWGVRTLTADLTAALGETAASVGRSVFTVLRHEVRVDAEGVAADDVEIEAMPKPEVATPPTREIAVQRDANVQREVIVLRKPPGHATAPDTRTQERIRMVVNGRELTPEEVAAHAGHAEVELRSDEHGGAPTLVLHGDGFARTIPLPRTGVDAALARYTRQLGWGLLVLLALGLALSVWLAQRIARPLRALADAAQTVGRGTLGAQAPDGGVPEVRATIAAFNRMSAQLQQLDAEATALRADRELAELGEIGRGLAHSLRNPLHALGLSLEALVAQAIDPARAQPLAQSGREQLQRVDQALRGFLALSAGNGAVPAPTSVREVIEDVLLEASQRAQGRVHFVREGEDVRLAAVAAELRVMLHTLVVNALEASPDGGTVTVRIVASDTAPGAVAVESVSIESVSIESVTIEISDEGAGVPDTIRARLFQPHVSAKPHGAGMGLYLAERLARLRYGGSITLEPIAPCGTRARLCLRPREVMHG